jgi:hypothetical protein
MRPNYIIAIDPDTERSGVAMLNTATKGIKCDCLTFPLLVDHLQNIRKWKSENNLTVKVYVEAGWLITHNWHVNSKDNKRTASAKGNSAGRNHEVGRKIIELCKHYGIDVSTILPLRKCWSGKDGKITQWEIEQFIPNFPKSSNQEVRDSALISWHMAGFPIQIKTKK